MPEDNGVIQVAPNVIEITLGWDHATQSIVPFKFSPEQFKSWEFIAGFLQMALDKAKFTRDMMQAQAIQQQQAQARHDAQLRAKLMGGR